MCPLEPQAGGNKNLAGLLKVGSLRGPSTPDDKPLVAPRDSHTAQEPHLDPTPEDQSGSTLLLIPRRWQIPKQKFKGWFMGMGEDGRVGLPRNLLHERLLWLLSHQ